MINLLIFNNFLNVSRTSTYKLQLYDSEFNMMIALWKIKIDFSRQVWATQMNEHRLSFFELLSEEKNLYLC